MTYLTLAPQETHSAAASMAELNAVMATERTQSLSSVPQKDIVAKQEAPKPAAAVAPQAEAAPPKQTEAVIKPAVTVHHVAKEAQGKLAKLNHGDMFMGVMFKVRMRTEI